MAKITETWETFTQEQKDEAYYIVGCIDMGYAQPPMRPEIKKTMTDVQIAVVEWLIAEVRKAKGKS